MKILWLASWYPNKISPLDGDFIQRHAHAVSIYTPLTVIYVAQYGEQMEVLEDRVEINNLQNLREVVAQFRFKKTQFSLIDKIRYNWKYYRTYKKLVKQYITENGVPSLVHVHVPMKAGVIARWMKKKWKIGYILSEQASTYMDSAPDSYQRRSLYHRSTVMKIFREAIFVTNVSGAISLQLQDLFVLKKVYTIHNTVDTNLFYFENREKRIFRFIHVSAMNHQKNVVGMLRSFSQLSKVRFDWQLTLVGPAGQELLNMIKDLNLQTFVTFTGTVPYVKVAELMRQSDSLVLFSRHENFPCVVVEALSCGLPVIASRIAGIPEAVNASNGLLVEPENENGLTNSLIQMLDVHDGYDRAKIAADARNKYNYETTGSQFMDLYKRSL